MEVERFREARWEGRGGNLVGVLRARMVPPLPAGGLVTHATQQAFLEAHEAAFRYFGGVFHRLRYDNLPLAVKRILRGAGAGRDDPGHRLRVPRALRGGVLHAGGGEGMLRQARRRSSLHPGGIDPATMLSGSRSWRSGEVPRQRDPP